MLKSHFFSNISSVDAEKIKKNYEKNELVTLKRQNPKID